jgi:hypothetical protein
VSLRVVSLLVAVTTISSRAETGDCCATEREEVNKRMLAIVADTDLCIIDSYERGEFLSSI